jgi:TATA-box binding protein (TBP) (component of TFIID and TFIIIB)
MNGVRINNYKVSLKLRFNNDKNYNILYKRMKNDSDHFRKKCKNFFTLKGLRHTYSIYTSGHVNVTGIRDINEIDNICSEIIKFTGIQPEHSIFRGSCFCIDNINATGYIGGRINISQFAQLSLIKDLTDFLRNDRNKISKNRVGIFYEPELFHAVKIVTDNGTCLLFSTGKINYLGSKSYDMLEWVVSRIEILYNLYKLIKPGIHLYWRTSDRSEYVNDISSKYIDPKNHLLLCNSM